MVAPARLSAVPKRDDPADGERLGRPGQEDAHPIADVEVVLLRRRRRPSRLVRASSAALPWTRWSGDSCVSGSKETPSVGARRC